MDFSFCVHFHFSHLPPFPCGLSKAVHEKFVLMKLYAGYLLATIAYFGFKLHS